MYLLRFFGKILLVQFIVGAALVIVGRAQQPGASRPASPAERQQSINDDMFRELMNAERENKRSAVEESDASRAARLKQLTDDFKTIQNVNNRMMGEAWAREQLDYPRLVEMISEINLRAVRLKSNLALPEPDSAKKKDAQLSVAGPKEFRSALLVMDRSLMSFVANPIFQRPNVVEIGLARRARMDLDQVIAISSDLKKITVNLKDH
jgi:hypothetical protein